jgi:hypothetical protein
MYQDSQAAWLGLTLLVSRLGSTGDGSLPLEVPHASSTVDPVHPANGLLHDPHIGRSPQSALLYALIHPSAWKVNSAKLNFRFTAF